MSSTRISFLGPTSLGHTVSHILDQTLTYWDSGCHLFLQGEVPMELAQYLAPYTQILLNGLAVLCFLYKEPETGIMNIVAAWFLVLGYKAMSFQYNLFVDRVAQLA